MRCLTRMENCLASGGYDHEARIWDISSRQCLRRLKGHSSTVQIIALDKERLATGAVDGEIRVWDRETGYAHRSIYMAMISRISTDIRQRTSSVLAIESWSSCTDQIERRVFDLESSKWFSRSFRQDVAQRATQDWSSPGCSCRHSEDVWSAYPHWIIRWAPEILECAIQRTNSRSCHAV